MTVRSTDDILVDVESLVSTKGYIYVLCLIILDDFHVDVERMDRIDVRSKLNKNEILLLFGFLIQTELDIEPPRSSLDLLELKKKTYALMEELHHSTMIPFMNKITPLINNLEQAQKSTERDFFGDEGMFVEPIFYSGDGIYDFQYLEFLDRKYKYDEQWLNSHANFHFDKVKAIVLRIKSLLQSKIATINFLGLKENRNKFQDIITKDTSVPKNERDQLAQDFLSTLEFYQYEALFETEAHKARGLSEKEIGENGWKSFYKNLIELFVFRKSEFSPELNIDSFLDKFTLPDFTADRNGQFKKIGDFNLMGARPIIRLDSERYFIPVPFFLFESVYESPFYWMQRDKSYADKLALNRGNAGEEIVFELLKKVFGQDQVYKAVKVVSKKGHDETDVDVLCILGSKALCIQVKSKKLTLLSRQGDLNQLMTDFKGAIQDAYDQALLCRARLLERSAQFMDQNGKAIHLSEEITDVYLMAVTTENYPSLAHQSRALLEKKETDPHALILTVFDLELILFYLTDPYEFLYYVRQRISMMAYYVADEEMYFLGYHLVHKLWKDPSANYVILDNDFGQLIDKNYYLFKLGIDVPPESDKIKSRWMNAGFSNLCAHVARANSPKKTDIIFYLLDWSAESRDKLMDLISDARGKTRVDGKSHNMSMMSRPGESAFGITYISWENNDSQKLSTRLLRHCRGRKYKSRANAWIGLGSLKDSPHLIDTVCFSDEEWKYDSQMDEEVKILFGGQNKGRTVSFDKSIGRNEPCPCGSGLKFKRCCGQK